MPKFRAAKGTTQVSLGGKTFDPDADGVFSIDDDQQLSIEAAEMMNFERVPDDTAPAKKR